MVVTGKGAVPVERFVEWRQLLLPEQRPGGADALRSGRELAGGPRQAVSETQLRCLQRQCAGDGVLEG